MIFILVIYYLFISNRCWKLISPVFTLDDQVKNLLQHYPPLITHLAPSSIPSQHTPAHGDTTSASSKTPHWWQHLLIHSPLLLITITTNYVFYNYPIQTPSTDHVFIKWPSIFSKFKIFPIFFNKRFFVISKLFSYLKIVLNNCVKEYIQGF